MRLSFDSKRFLSPRAVAERLGKSERFVLRLIATRELPAYDLRSPGVTLPRWRIDWKDVQLWVGSRRTVKPTPPPTPTRHNSAIRSAVRQSVKYPDLLD